MKLNIDLVLATPSAEAVCDEAMGKPTYLGYASSLFESKSLLFLWIYVAAIYISGLIAKMCIVPLSDEHAMYFETGSKAKQNISAVSVPLLNSYNKFYVSVSNILISVPLSDAVASRLPSVLRVSAAIAD